MSGLWIRSHRADPRALPLADRHYTRQKPGSPQFVNPGRCLVLLTPELDALWVTSWPLARYVKHAWAGAWTCALFRNESKHLSSDLIREAVSETIRYYRENPKWHSDPIPEHGFVTFIHADKVRRKRDPGRCYVKAGWSRLQEQTKGGLVVLQLRPDEFPQETNVAFQTVTIDNSINNIEPSGAQRIHVREGEYLMEVAAIRPSAENYTKAPFLSVRCVLLEGADPGAKGKTLSTVCTFTENAYFKLGQFLAAVGFDQGKLAGKSFDSYAKFKQLAEYLEKGLKGKKLGGMVGDDNYNGQVSSRVVEFYKAELYAERSKYQVQAAAPAGVGAADESGGLGELLGDVEFKL